MSDVVHLALGANLGPRRDTLDEAVRRIDALPSTRVLARSAVRETKALLPPDDDTPQPDYLNAAVLVETGLQPRALFEAVKAIERALGRQLAPRWAPRCIDIDVVLWGARRVEAPDLVIPHPRLHERRFVLEPLVELSPDAIHPVLGLSLRALLEALDG